MDLSILKNHASRAFAALLALSVCTGIAQAANLLAVTGSPTLTCDTHTGAGTAGTFTVKPAGTLSGSTTIAVTIGSSATGVTVTPPATTSLSSSNASAGLTYSVNVSAAGCVGLTSGSQTLVTFKANGTTDASGTGTISAVVTSNGSGLTVTSTVTVTCIKTVVSGGSTTYAPGPAVSVAVGSSSNIGTAFTVDNSTAAPPSWLSVTPLAGGTATSAAPVSLSLAAASNCGGLTSAPSAGTVTLDNLPGTAKTFTVNMSFTTVNEAASPLAPVPSTASFTYVKGSGSPGHADVNVASSASPAPFFTVDLTTLPNWLSVDSSSGTAGKTIRFSSTSICDSLAPGTYTAQVGLKVSGDAPFVETVSLLITNSAPKLSISGGLTQTNSWAVGSALPTATITAISTDSPIPFTVTTGGQLAPVVASSQLTGLAYSFGTPISVSFSPLQFAAAQPGSTLSGTVSLTWGTPAVTTVVTLIYNVTAPGSAVSSISPASLPTSGVAGQQFPATLFGTGFVVSTDPSQKTKVGIVTGTGGSQVLATDPNITWSVSDSSHIYLTFVVPSSGSNDALAPLFAPSGSGGSITIGVCNPNGSTCTTPTGGTVTLSIGASPIIQAVSSASTFAQVTAPALQTIAPFDMLSIFGSNFCAQYAASGSQGCSSTTVLSAVPNALTETYPTSVTPDSGSTARLLQVGFWPHGVTPTGSNVIAYAPILFATNSQINILAPSALATNSYPEEVDMYVSFGYGAGVQMSQAYPINVVAADPGIFTVGSDGQGGAAALGPNYNVINTSTPAGVREPSGGGSVNNSDIVSLYVTGLGVPDSTGSNSASQSSVLTFPAGCVSTAAYLSALNALAGSSLTTLDGTVIQSSLLNTYTVSSTTYYWIPPCMKTATTYTATVGGVNAPVTYAGWVANSVAGLYQINLQLPAISASFQNAAGTAFAQTNGALNAPASLPVVITATTGSVTKTSQAGVTIPVAPSLLVAAPALLSGTVGVVWCNSSCVTNSSNLVVASLSPMSGPSYSYALTAGLLPNGLSLNGATGAITGEPGANTAGTYNITITATDNSPRPVSGSVSFTLTVAGGLYVISSGTAPYTVTVPASGTTNVTTVTATGGAYPYNYFITAPGSIPTGMAVGASSGVLTLSNLTPAGTYAFQVEAVDTNLVNGYANFTVNIQLALTCSTPASSLSAGTGAGQAVSTCSTLGQSGTITYSLAGTTTGFAIDSATGAITTNGSVAAGSVTNLQVVATDSAMATGSSATATRTITLPSFTVGS